MARNRYVEHFFRRSDLAAKPIAEILADLDSVAATGLGLVLGINGTIGNTHIWATSTGGPVDGTWRQIADRINGHRMANRVYVATWQTLGQGYLFYQPEFARIG